MSADAATLAGEVTRALALADWAGESRVRVTLTRGAATPGLTLDGGGPGTRIVLAMPLGAIAPEAYEQGIDAALVRLDRPAQLAGAKVTSYLPELLALHEARARGASEALLVDARGCVVEGATSSVLALRGSTLVTPGEGEGALPGVTAATIEQLAPALGLRFERGALTIAEVLAADEVLLASTVREVVPVVRVDGQAIGAGAPGPVARALLAALRREAALAAP